MAVLKTLSFLFAFFALAIKILIDLDFNRVVYNHTPGECHYIEGLDSGSEDIVLLSNGLALISSGMMMRAPGLPHSNNVGKIYLYDANAPEKRPKNLLITGAKFYPSVFRPAGLTVWENEDKISVYAVNTYSQEIYVFLLNIAKKSLNFVKALSHPLLTNPNNIVAIDEDKFYVTNFVSSSNVVLLNLELSLKLPFGSVFYYDGNHFLPVVEKLQGPNGVALSPNKQYLYVAHHTGRRLNVYSVNQNRTLSEIMQIPIPTSLDNVNVDNAGRLWIGAQPILHQLVLHMQNPPKYLAASQVIRVTFDEGHKKYDVEEVFADDGEELRAVTSAAVYKNVLLIGTLYDKAMWCKLSN